MSKAYIIEVRNRTAGIVAGDENGFRFFSSDRAFDSLEGREFHPLAMRSARRECCSTRDAIRRAGSYVNPPRARDTPKGRIDDR